MTADWPSDVDRTLVRLVEDVGEILGYDGRDYELLEGDVVTIPKINAEPLLNQGAAVAIEADGSPSAADARLAEAKAVAGDPSGSAVSPPDFDWKFNDWLWARHRRDQEDTTTDPDDLLMAAMGDPDAVDRVGTGDIEDDRSPTSSTPSSNGVSKPESALPIAQLDALSPEDRRRAARKRGVEWPSTRDARDRLMGTITQVMRHQDVAVVDAPTALGKSHTVATTSWASERSLKEASGGNPVVHLSATRDARDESVEAAREAGVDYMTLRSRHEACPVAAGDYDPPSGDADQNELDYQPITIQGEPASQWIEEMCDGRELPFSAVHRHLEGHNDQGRDLPCCSESPTTFDEEEGEFEDGESPECPAIEQWDEWRSRRDNPELGLDVVFATHNFAHVPGIRRGTNLVIDEEPDFTADLGKERVERAIAAYLQAVDAPVTTWEAFIQLSLYDGYGDDAAHEREALQDALQEDPDRKHFFENPDAHTMAPALARAIFNAEDRGNGRRVGKTPHEPPRLDAGAVDEDGWNREWVTVVLDEDNDIKTVRCAPDVSQARSVVGLDAWPARPIWAVNLHPDIQTKQVLDSQERQLWRRYERGLRVVQVGEATRPLASGEYFQPQQVEALVEHLVDEYGGEQVRTAITTKSVEERLRRIMDQAGAVEPSTMHYGEEKSRNDFAHENVGFVNGCIDPGDELVLDVLAELDCDAAPETSESDDGEVHRARGRGFDGPDADVAEAVLASVRENHTAQAAGRYARNADDPDDFATVFVRTDAMPPGFADVQSPGVQWTYSNQQREIVAALRDSTRALTAREISNAVDCSKRHVQKTLSRLLPDGDDRRGPLQAFENAGPHGATLYSTDGLPNSGVVDLAGVTANDPVWSSYTWSFAIRDADLPDQAESNGGEDATADSTVWNWRDPPPDEATAEDD
ncbi:MAG: hypothetical protein ABEH81_04115 [Halopenitus sp.]